MLLVLQDVLSGEDLARIRAEAETLPFSDGKTTAGPQAAQVKRNQQADISAAADVSAFVQRALLRHPAFAAAAQVRRFGPMLVSRYRTGMEYGVHVDNALMGDVRADLSVTLFLSDPDSYDGGALRLDLSAGEQSVRLPAGCAVLYPTGVLHAVEPVTRGERLAVVGWIESRVRGIEKRETLFDIANLRASLAGGLADSDSRLLAQKIEANLLRLWSD